MSAIRSEISEKNRYYISKERFLELKHFCLQYPEWQKELKKIDFSVKSKALDEIGVGWYDTSIVEKYAIDRSTYEYKIKLVEKAAKEASEEFYDYILECVTQGVSCNYLITTKRMPCCRDTFYILYRKFFWFLANS